MHFGLPLLALGYRVEVSKGVDADVPDDGEPADSTPTPTEPEPDKAVEPDVQPEPFKAPQVPPFDQPLPSV